MAIDPPLSLVVPPEMGPATSSVNSPSAAVTAMRAIWDMTNALMNGTKAMREAREIYLPPWPEEEDDSYDDRLSKSTLFPAYKRTVVTLAARPFSKPISFGDDVPEKFKPWLDNVDLQGNNCDAFMSETFKHAMADGLVGIFAEHPPRPPDAKTQADDKTLGMRPYFVRVRASQLLGWRTVTEGGSIKLEQLRYIEEVEEPFGEFGTRTIEQVRVLKRGSWETWRAGQNKDSAWVLFDKGTTNLKEIPFTLIYGERIGFMMAKPPLLELAHLNVKHWQQQSDQDNLMHVARVPILCTAGVDSSKFKLVIGSSAAVDLGENPQAKLEYVEHTGAAIDSGKVQLDDLKEEMRQSGAELLVLRPAPSTATEVASDNAVGMCALQELAMGAEDALDQALQFWAEYVSEAQGGHCTLFKDFGAATLADTSFAMLLAMSNSSKLSNETLVDEAKRRGIVGSEVTWETEQERMDSQGPPPGFVPALPPGAQTPPGAPKPPAPPPSPFGKDKKKKKPAAAAAA